MARERAQSLGLLSKPTGFEMDMDNISVSSSDDDNDEIVNTHSQSAFFKSFPQGSAQRPLISFVKNKWDTSHSSRPRSASSSSSSASFDWHRVPCLGFIASIVMAPKFRRYLVVYALLLMFAFTGWESVLKPMMKEHEDILTSLNVDTLEKVGGWFGTNVRPEFVDVVPMRTLNSALLPSLEKNQGRLSSRRLVIVGDVHGCQDELEKLLKKVSFDPNAGDHLILTGDMINKGPKSGGVVDLARNFGASCVRGNHEDRILLERSDMKVHDNGSSKQEHTVVADTAERKVAMSLTDEQAAWLQDCPVILKVGQIKDMGEVAVVHGGLVPGVPLERQELSSVMSMRTIDLDTHVPSASKDGMPWFKLYNQYHKLLASGQEQTDSVSPKTMTVIYGHDAAKSLNIRQYTKGLDSGCVYGRKLSALVIEDGGKNEIVQVKCDEYVKS